MADPGFPAGGHGPRRVRRGLPRRLCFENFVRQNERIWTLGGHAPGTPRLDPPMVFVHFMFEPPSGLFSQTEIFRKINDSAINILYFDCTTLI